MSITNTFFITTPLYYVNDVPHIGSAYTTLICDSIARFRKLAGEDVIFTTGVDEHGGKIEKTALDNNLSPQDHCNNISDKFIDLWQLLNIKYNNFARTSSPEHNQYVHDFWNKVYEQGDIYEGEYTGKYCLACEDFKTDHDLITIDGQECCNIHKTPIQDYAEKNYFFKLSKYTEQIRQFLNDNPNFVQPAYRLHEINQWLKEGLKDFPISRRSVNWGIPVPQDNSQTIYVWFDALLGYYSSLQNHDTVISNLENQGACHIVGKDILRFHAVYLIAMFMSAKMPLPSKIFGHGFLTKDGQKMGKTTGNTIDPYELINKYSADAVRFFFLFQIPFGNDGDYSESNFIDIVNSYLANRIGNLCSRVLKLSKVNMNSTISEHYKFNTDSIILKPLQELPNQVYKAIQDFETHNALKYIFDYIDLINLQLSNIKPWTLFKSDKPEDIKQAEILISECIVSLRTIGNLLYAFMPNLGLQILQIYNLDTPDNWDRINSPELMCPGDTIQQINALFNRIAPQD